MCFTRHDFPSNSHIHAQVRKRLPQQRQQPTPPDLFLLQILMTTHYLTLYYLQNNMQVKSPTFTMVRELQ